VLAEFPVHKFILNVSSLRLSGFIGKRSDWILHLKPRW